MPQPINKQLIQSRFRKSFKTYDQEASVQELMADHLLNKLIEHKGLTYKKIFEIGSGTGLLTRKIIEKINFDNFITNDIVEESSSYIPAKHNIKFITGDAESINFPESLDLIISNATFQWFLDIPSIVNKSFESLNDDGLLVFSSFSSENIREIKEITGYTLDYKSVEELKAVYLNKFIPLYEYAEINILYFDTSFDVLRHLKQSGVNSLSNNRWTKGQLKDFEKKYTDKFSINGKVTLTYYPTYIILQKKKIGR